MIPRPSSSSAARCRIWAGVQVQMADPTRPRKVRQNASQPTMALVDDPTAGIANQHPRPTTRPVTTAAVSRGRLSHIPSTRRLRPAICLFLPQPTRIERRGL